MTDPVTDPVTDPLTDPVAPRITLISKPGCHLCVPARAVIDRVARDLGLQWVELSILDDAELSAAYWEQIPVTLVDGVEHDYWRVDESRLRRALESPREHGPHRRRCGTAAPD